MDVPGCFPNPGRSSRQIEELLARVRNLDSKSKTRLRTMLADEMDLPYLDAMERAYHEVFRQIAPEHATQLRSRFVTAINAQRAFLTDLVLKALDEQPAPDGQGDTEREPERGY